MYFQGQAQVNSYVTREEKFECVKMSWANKLHRNKIKLLQLQRQLGVSPTSSVGSNTPTPLIERQKIGRGSLPNATLKNRRPTLQTTSADVIEIDDDE